MNVAIVGSGNVATALARGLRILDDVWLTQVISRNKQEGEFLASICDCHFTQSLHDLDEDINVCIICVSDSAISQVAERLPMHSATLYAHTSGSMPASLLNRFAAFGVFYPLQTLSKDRELAWTSIPIFVTGSDLPASSTLSVLGSKLGSTVKKITDHQRTVLHLAAVIANNFSVALYSLASEIMEQNEMDSQLLHPLMKEGTDKACLLGPKAAQTGPALRGDLETINRHLKLLSHDPELTQLYRNLTKLIQRLHG